jgi:hypothetical protein
VKTYIEPSCQRPARPPTQREHTKLVLTRKEINSARSVVRSFKIGSDLKIPGPASSVGEGTSTVCFSAIVLNGSVAGIVWLTGKDNRRELCLLRSMARRGVACGVVKDSALLPKSGCLRGSYYPHHPFRRSQPI